MEPPLASRTKGKTELFRYRSFTQTLKIRFSNLVSATPSF